MFQNQNRRASVWSTAFADMQRQSDIFNRQRNVEKRTLWVDDFPSIFKYGRKLTMSEGSSRKKCPKQRWESNKWRARAKTFQCNRKPQELYEGIFVHVHWKKELSSSITNIHICDFTKNCYFELTVFAAIARKSPFQLLRWRRFAKRRLLLLSFRVFRGDFHFCFYKLENKYVLPYNCSKSWGMIACALRKAIR